jgi:hypothetical protein
MSSAAAAFSGDAGTPPAGTPPAGPAGTPPADAGGIGGTGGSGTPPAAPAANGEWYSTIADEGIRTWAAAKGWKDPTAVVESAYNLEKLIGFDRAGRTLVVPGDDATPEQIKAFHQKLGVPATAEEYAPHIKVPEVGGDPEFAKTAASKFHELGITPKQAEALSTWFNEQQGGAVAKMQEQAAEASNKAFGEVVARWGKDADMNLEMGKRAAQSFIPAKDPAERQVVLAKIEAAIGTEAMLTMFANIGKNLGEHRMASGEPSGMGMSANEALTKRAQLMGDPAWTKDYATNKTKQDLMFSLNKVIADAQDGAAA